jgi:hypothetical protein
MRVSKIVPSLEELNQVIEEILKVSEKWQIQSNNFYFQTTISWNSCQDRTSFSPNSYCHLSSSILLKPNVSPLKFQSLICRGLSQVIALNHFYIFSCAEVLASLPILDTYYWCGQSIPVSPLDKNDLEIGLWVENKGVHAKLVYDKNFLNELCYCLWHENRSYPGWRINDNDLLFKKYLRWFADHVSCPFWKFQEWETEKREEWQTDKPKYCWISRYQEDLKNLRKEAYQLWKKIFILSKQSLQEHLADDLVRVCFDYLFVD